MEMKLSFAFEIFSQILRAINRKSIATMTNQLYNIFFMSTWANMVNTPFNLTINC